MAAEKLAFSATQVFQSTGTDGINHWTEKQLGGGLWMELFRVTSNESGDWFFCKRIGKIQAVAIQNHGATFATGVARDSPKYETRANKITITHSATREVFSVLVIGKSG